MSESAQSTSDRLTDEQLDRLDKLEREATEGPWENCSPTSVDFCGNDFAFIAQVCNPRKTERPYDSSGDGERASLTNPRFKEACHNAILIAESRNALRSLIEEVRALRAREGARQTVARVRVKNIRPLPDDRCPVCQHRLYTEDGEGECECPQEHGD